MIVQWERRSHKNKTNKKPRAPNANRTRCGSSSDPPAVLGCQLVLECWPLQLWTQRLLVLHEGSVLWPSQSGTLLMRERLSCWSSREDVLLTLEDAWSWKAGCIWKWSAEVSAFKDGDVTFRSTFYRPNGWSILSIEAQVNRPYKNVLFEPREAAVQSKFYFCFYHLQQHKRQELWKPEKV